MAVVIKKRRLINPTKAKRRPIARPKSSPRPKRKAHRARTKKNPALLTLGFLNPTKKRGSMKKQKQNRKKNPARRPKTNPFFARKAKAPRRRHRNPSAGSILSRPLGMAKAGTIAFGSLLLTRQVPQWILGANNTGWLGYLANVSMTIANTVVAHMAAGKEAAFSAGIGGTLYVLNRVMTEQFSPIGKYISLSGVGDAAASSKMGALRPGYYPVPVRYDQSGNPIIPQAILDAAATAARGAVMPAQSMASAAGVGRLASRF